jgi:hypothetical protein
MTDLVAQGMPLPSLSVPVQEKDSDEKSEIDLATVLSVYRFKGNKIFFPHCADRKHWLTREAMAEQVEGYLSAYFTRLGALWVNPLEAYRLKIGNSGFRLDYEKTSYGYAEELTPEHIQGFISQMGMVALGRRAFVRLGRVPLYDWEKIITRWDDDLVAKACRSDVQKHAEGASWIRLKSAVGWINPAYMVARDATSVDLGVSMNNIPLTRIDPADLDKVFSLPWLEYAPGKFLNAAAVRSGVSLRTGRTKIQVGPWTEIEIDDEVLSDLLKIQEEGGRPCPIADAAS